MLCEVKESNAGIFKRRPLPVLKASLDAPKHDEDSEEMTGGTNSPPCHRHACPPLPPPFPWPGVHYRVRVGWDSVVGLTERTKRDLQSFI